MVFKIVKKITQRLIKGDIFFVSIPILFLVVIVRPFVLIRFGYFFSDRIGHFAFDVEYYLCQKSNINQKKTLDIFCILGTPCNSTLTRMVKRKIKITNKVVAFCELMNAMPFAASHIIKPAKEVNGSRDLQEIFQNSARNLDFSAGEMLKGEEFLRAVGLREDDQYVCLIVRDSAYLSSNTSRDFSYHDYRDSDISSYKKTAKTLADKGYWVFRMGKMVKHPFNCAESKVIDYASSSSKSDFLDIWLTAHCKFAISTSTGLDAISEVFRIPMVFVNHLPVGNLKTGDPRHIELFKTLKWKTTQQPLSLKEHIATGAINFQSLNRYQEQRIEIDDNSEDDILYAALEMESRLSGDWIEEPKDKILQEKFYKILESWDDYKNYHGHARSLICANFLRKNQDWFLR